MKKDFTLFSYYFFFVNRVKIFRGTKKCYVWKINVQAFHLQLLLCFFLKLAQNVYLTNVCMHINTFIKMSIIKISIENHKRLFVIQIKAQKNLFITRTSHKGENYRKTCGYVNG